jgi:hypothetical protein
MSDTKQAWNEVGAQFSGLGERLKEHFSHQPPRAAGDAGADTTANAAGPTAPVGEIGDAPGEGTAGGAGAGGSDAGAADALKSALKHLGEALDGVVEAVGGAAKDPAVAEDVRHVGQSLVNALSATFADASGEIRKAFNRDRPPSGTDGQPDAGTDDQPDVTAP